MRTFVYVDGFNLYYGALKNTEHKWLNIKALCERLLLPSNRIERIKYFSARVSDKISEGASARQQQYIHALSTLPEVEIIWGNFITRPKIRKIASLTAAQSEHLDRVKRGLAGEGLNPAHVERVIEATWSYMSVFITEEKGSDVNLAAHLLNDAHKNLYDVAVVISNDTDLAEPIRIIRHEMGKQIGIVCPHKTIAEPLKNIPPSFVRHINAGDLRRSQFPAQMENGASKPDGWE